MCGGNHIIKVYRIHWDLLKFRRRNRSSPPRSFQSKRLKRGSSPFTFPLTAASFHFVLIEFRVGGRKQNLVRVTVEHQPERNHFNLRFTVGLPEYIDRADGICGFAPIAVPALDQRDISLLECLTQSMEVRFDRQVSP
jgi:hypothetical protein